MKQLIHTPIAGGLILALAALSASSHALSQAIPEPSLVIYGVIRNGNIRMAVGSVTWRFQNGNRVVDVSAPVTNINDQFSYVLKVPCESEIGGFLASSNALRLLSTPLVYDRSQVTFTLDAQTHPLTFTNSAQNSISLTSRDRGRIERVDFNLSASFTDANDNGIPDWWEYYHFGQYIDPLADPDGDGLNNLAEYQAGTDPNKAESQFAFIGITAVPPNAVSVVWSSIPGRIYTVERSTSLFDGFTALATNIQAVSTNTSFMDTNAIESGLYFYRLKLESTQ